MATLIDRLRMLWQGKPATGVGAFPVGSGGQSSFIATSWDFTRIANSVYGNPTGFRSIEAIASNLSRPAWIILPEDALWPQLGDEQKAIKNHPLLQVLNKPGQQASQQTSGTMMVRSWGRDLELTGKAFWVKMRGFDGFGRGSVSGLRRLPPQRVSVVGNQDDELIGFVYTDRSGRQQPVLPEDVVYLRYPHPERVYDGMAPALVAGLAAETDNASSRFNRDLLSNDTAMPGFLMVPGLTPDAFAKWKEEWERGGLAGKTRFLGGQDAKYVRVGMTNQELTYGELRRDSQDDILRAFGVPRAVAFDTADTTYANADAEKAMFMQQLVLPKWILLADELTLQLGQEQGVRVAFDLTGIDELQDSKNAVTERGVKLMSYKALTINEFRRSQGWPDVSWGDEPQAPLQPMSAIPLQPGDETEPKENRPGLPEAKDTAPALPVPVGGNGKR